MLKHINKILKIVGLNLIHSKKPKARKPYTVAELVNSKPSRHQLCGETHYVGDPCPGGHVDDNTKNV